MPKKKNFLGGMQNYNAETGEYEPALVGSNGERPSSFKSFKKEDSEFKKANDKRLGKITDKDVATLSNEERLKEGGLKGRFERAGYNVSNVSDKEMTVEGRFRIVDIGNGGFDVYDGEEKIAEDIGNQKDFVALIEKRMESENGKSEFDKANDKRLGKAKEESDDEKDVGKIIKYQPMLNNKGNFDYGEDVRAKKLNNGLAMETKKYSKSHTYFGSNGQYKLVDIESGLSVGWANSYEEALKKSKDKDFIGAIERARKSYWDRHPERKRTPTDPEVIKTANKIRSSGDSYTYQMLDRLRTDVAYVLDRNGAIEGLWYDGNPTKHIALMKELYNGLKEKPEWLTMDKINEYEKRFKELED